MNTIDPNRVHELRTAGMAWRSIGAELGCSEYAARAAVDRAYAARCNARKAELRRAERIASPLVRAPRQQDHGATRADAAARFAEIPPDTRDLTGLLLGDPLPARSALARHLQREI